MQIRTKRVLPICLATLGFLACSAIRGSGGEPNDPPRFSFAYVQPACGPADGPALQFYFSTKQAEDGKYEVPYLLVSINADLPDSAPRDYSIAAGRGQMLASRCISPGGCAAAISGTLHLTKFNPGKGASGDYELHFKDGTVEKGQFDAKWYAVKNLMCG